MNIELNTDKKTWKDEWFDKVYDEFCDYYVDDGGHDKQLKNKIISSIEQLLRKQRVNCADVFCSEDDLTEATKIGFGEVRQAILNAPEPE